MDITNKLKLNSSISYALTVLDLSGTADMHDFEKLDNYSMRILIKNLSKTNAKSSLKQVIVTELAFPSDKLKEAFALKGLNVLVYGIDN